MKKKFGFALIFVLPITIYILELCVLGLTSCKKNDVPNHTHNYEVTVIEPTCTEQGYTLHECSCGEKYSDETVSPVGHDYVEGVCTKCGDVRVIEHEHDFADEWTVDTSATCSKKGSKSRHCKICGAKTDVTALALLEHNYVGNVCIVCGDERAVEATGLEYTLSDDQSYYIVSGIGSETRTKFIIPSTHEGKPVKEIGEFAFSFAKQEDSNGEKHTIKEVVVPNSITSIGEGAFSGCGDLNKITIAESVTSIGERAFEGCYVKSASIPACAVSYIANADLETVTITSGDSIGDYAFSGCWKLTKVTIVNSVTKIGSSAFSGCSNLTSITIPDSVTSIGDSAFANCPIETATIPAIACNYIDISKLKTVRITSGLIGDGSFSGCTGLVNVTIDNGVTSIGYAAFSGCSSLESMTLPFVGNRAGVTENDTYQYPFGYIFGTSSYTGSTETKQYYHGSSTTSNTSSTYYIPSTLKSVTITGGNILYGAFYNCSNLTSITIPGGVTSIAGGAFYGCSSLTNITIPDSVTSIGESAFSGCYKLVEVINKSSLDITKGSSNYGDVAYYALNVKTTDTSDIVNVNDYLFYTYDNVNYLVGYAGNDTALVLHDNYNGQNYKIYKYAFYNCYKLTSITIPDSVTSIGNEAFSNCSSLLSITIGNGVTSIGSYAFYHCYKLVEVINKSNINITKGSTSNGCVAYYALKVKTEGASDIVNVNNYLFYTYNSVNYLLGYVGNDTELVLPENYKGQSYEMYEHAFDGCCSLISITIPDGVSSITSYAFYGCSSLASITIPNSITLIGDDVFSGCSSLKRNEYDNAYYLGNANNPYLVLVHTKSTSITSCTINKNTKVIYGGAFNYCSSLTSITIPDGVTSIGSWAFSNCSKLTSITIPESVTSIGSYAFYHCSKLTSITIPNSIASICGRAFSGCSSLTSITIPDNVTSIGNSAFSGSSSLQSITIPDSVTSIGNSAFQDCSRLTTINFKGTKAQWEAVSKGSYWTTNASFTVYCTDGNIVYGDA